MAEMKSECEALTLEQKKKRLERHRLKLGDNIKMYLQIIIIYLDVDMIHLVVDRVQRWLF